MFLDLDFFSFTLPGFIGFNATSFSGFASFSAGFHNIGFVARNASWRFFLELCFVRKLQHMHFPQKKLWMKKKVAFQWYPENYHIRMPVACFIVPQAVKLAMLSTVSLLKYYQHKKWFMLSFCECLIILILDACDVPSCFLSSF